MRIATGEVTARCAHVGHEQGVTHKYGSSTAVCRLHHIGQISRRVAGHSQGAQACLPQRQYIAIGQQTIKICATLCNVALHTVNVGKCLLYGGDALTNRYRGMGVRQLCPQPLRGR